MTSPESPVLLSRVEGVATVTLNRPKAYNAFAADLKTALLAVLRDVADDDTVRAVVITGAGRAFCAGQDLKEHQSTVREDPAAVGRTVVEFYNPMVELVTGMGKPVIAAVNGVAAGAGAALAYACDLRVAARSAVFRTSFAQVGLTADSGLSYTLPRLIGAGRARRLTLLDAPMDAPTAHAWGAVDVLAEDEEFPAVVEALARQLAAGPTTAYAWIKKSFFAGADRDLRGALSLENEGQQACFASADHHEALQAFLERRPPVFTGR